MPKAPLVIDLDNTLINSDTTYELCVEHIKNNIFIGLFQLFFWFILDKASAKDKLTRLYLKKLNLGKIPLTDLITLNLYKKAPVKVLVSGSDHRIVSEIANQIGDFEFFKGTTPGSNLTGANKAKFLEDRYPKGFDYIGDSIEDINIWKKALKAYGYNVSTKVIKEAHRQGIDLHVLSQKPGWIKPTLKSMRLHQWSKNVLIMMSPFLNLGIFKLSWIFYLFFGFVAFGLVASATYMINDLLDIQADRAHRTKKSRPFASGALCIKNGLVSIIALICVGFFIAFSLRFEFGIMLLVYTFISMTYSFWLKQIIVLDTLTLSFLFCWRVLAGSILLAIPFNTWFIVFLGFFFLGLALGKRAIELNAEKNSNRKIAGRGYQKKDFLVVLISGISSSFACIIILLIYAILSTATVVNNDISAIFIVFILLFWQMRFWLLVVRKQIHDDPIIFALRDRMSFSSVACMAIIIIMEQFDQITRFYNG